MSGCSGSTSTIPPGWTPNGQRFRFTGRSGYNEATGQNDLTDRLDNIRLYNSKTPTPANLLAQYTIDDHAGLTIFDSSGNLHNARVSSVQMLGTRSGAADDPDYVINMVDNGSLRTTYDSARTQAWQDFYDDAVVVATDLKCNGHSRNDLLYGGPDGTIEEARELGLAYLVVRGSGETLVACGNLIASEQLFSNAARVLGDMLINVAQDPNLIGAYGDYGQAGRIGALGMLYDSFYSVFDQNYRNSLANAIKLNFDFKGTALPSLICGGPSGTILNANWQCEYNNGVVSPIPNSVAGHAYYNNMVYLSALLALSGDDLSGVDPSLNSKVENLLNIEFQAYVNGYYPMKDYVNIDGGDQRGYTGYAALYNSQESVHLWDTAVAAWSSSVTNPPSAKTDWQNNVIYRHIYAMRADRTFPRIGNTSGRGLQPEDEYVTMSALWSSKYFNNGYGQRYYNQWIRPWKSRLFLNELLYWEAGKPELPIEQLPLSRLFRNAGQVIMRDSWDYQNSTMVEFKSTSFFNEGQHLDQNAFTIFYKTPLLLDSGYYDSYGSIHWRNYFNRTIAHNTITVWDPTEIYPGGNYRTLPHSNDGGQWLGDSYASLVPTLDMIVPGGVNHIEGIGPLLNPDGTKQSGPDRYRFEYHPEFTYAGGNASRAYWPGKLDSVNGFVRSLVFLRQPSSFWNKPITVVFDKVTAAQGKGGLTKRFLLHTVNEPLIHQLPSSIFEVRNGGGMLFSQTLLPVDPILTKIGGGDSSNQATDYRFMVPRCSAYNTDLALPPCNNNSDYKLTPFSPDMNELFPNDPIGAATLQARIDADVEKGAWRVEITAPIPTRREYFLHVLSVADNGAVSAPPTAQNLSSATAAVALLANTQTIAFSKSDQPAITISWDSPIVGDNMIITGLAPSTRFNGYLQRNPSPSTPYTVILAADTNGVLTSSAQGVVTVNTSLPLKTTLTVNKTGSGTGTLTSNPTGINCGSDCTEPYNVNTTVTLTATPNTGSVFSSWTGCTSTSGNTCTVNMNDNKSVTANFTPLLFRSPTANVAQKTRAGDNNGYLTNPGNVHTPDDNNVAVDTNSGNNNATTCTDNGKDKHYFYNYGFTIPTGSTIKGIEVRLRAKADSTSGSPKICVQLSWDNGTSWTTAKSTATLSTTLTTYTLGTATDLWSRSGWTAANFNNGSFRVRVIDVSSSTSRDFSLDGLDVRVTY